MARFVVARGKQIDRIGKSDLEWTADKLLKGAGVGSDPIEIDVPLTITSGTYSGDGTDNRAIAHGLGVTPKYVLIMSLNNYFVGCIVQGYNVNVYANTNQLCTSWDATNFYVVDTTVQFNDAATNYNWVAIA